MLRVEQLSFAYGDLHALWDVTLEVGAGEVVALVGANGAGKSTLLGNISRLLRPGAGRIEFEGADLGSLPAHAVAALGVVQVPEGRRIFPELTVLENLLMGSYVRATRRDRPRNLDRAFTLFPRLGARRAQLGGTLSGGEQQMLAIARGLMANPRLLLLDEPSLGLSPLLARNIFDIVHEINRQGTSVLLVEQNVHQALRVAGRGYVLETGRVVLAGTGPELLAHPDVRKAFLGR
jgi:branched-chain amino acid transport system ATP-binding protein